MIGPKMNRYVMNLCVFSIVLGMFTLSFSSVRADEEKKDGAVLSSQASAPAPAKYTKFNLSYFGIYSGPAVTAPTKNGTINSSTLEYDDTSPQNLWNQVKLDYNFNEDVFVGAIATFLIIPVNPNNPLFTMYDSGVRVGNRHIIHTDSVNLSADLRVLAPIRPSYVKRDEKVNLQSLVNFTYSVPKSNWTLGFLTFNYYQAYGSGIPTRDPGNPSDPHDLTLYFAPNVSYQITPTLAATVYYEMYPWHLVGAGLTSFGSDPSDIAPGISWDITPTINFSPQVLIYPSRLSVNTLSTVAYLSAKLL